MSETSPTTRIRLLLAALVVASVLGLTLSAVYATDAVLSIIERLQRLPLWLGVLTGTLVSTLVGASGVLVWRLLRPRRTAPRLPAITAIDRSSVDARLARIESTSATSGLSEELAELDRRATLDQVHVALFGDVSAFWLRTQGLGIAIAMGLANSVAASCQCCGFLVIHGHAGEGFAHLGCGLQRVWFAVDAFRVHINQAHLHGSERVFHG